MTRWIAGGEARHSLPFDDRSWQYGDGLFETIAIRGGKPRLLDWHMERLDIGCRRLGLVPPPVATIAADIDAAVATADTDTAYALAKLVVTAGQGPRGYARAGARTSHYLAVFEGRRLAAEHYRNGVAVRTCNTRLAQQPQLAGIKSLNRLEQVLARSEWDDPSIFEGLTCDTDGSLICGTMSNVFIVTDNTLMTPDLSRSGVAGVMRRQVIEIAHRNELPVAVQSIPRDTLAAASEVFLTNSQFGLLPVASLDGRTLDVGEHTRSVARMLGDAGIEEMTC